MQLAISYPQPVFSKLAIASASNPCIAESRTLIADSQITLNNVYETNDVNPIQGLISLVGMVSTYLLSHPVNVKS